MGMADQLPSEGGPIPEPPEAPEWLKTVQWFVHHFTREGQMIRQAPVAFIVTSVLTAWGFHWFENKQHADEVSGLKTVVATHEATMKNQEATITQLQDQLRGTSPQLAAIQAGRDKIRAKLQEFYTTSGELVERKIETEADFDKYESDINKWKDTCAHWIESNMGVAARERFLDPAQLPSLAFEKAVNPRQNNVLNNFLVLRKILSVLIETAAWDGLPPSKD
jgi:hypothetical protein